MNFKDFKFPVLNEPSDNEWNNITELESEIISLLLKGKTAREIGKEMELSHRTIEAYKLRICEKLKAKNITNALAIFCVEYFSRYLKSIKKF